MKGWGGRCVSRVCACVRECVCKVEWLSGWVGDCVCGRWSVSGWAGYVEGVCSWECAGTLCTWCAYTVSRTCRTCVFPPVPRSYGNVAPCLHLTLQLTNQTHLCFFFYEPLVIISFHFSPLHSSLLFNPACHLQCEAALCPNNRESIWLILSMHALKTLKSSILLFLPVCVFLICGYYSLEL